MAAVDLATSPSTLPGAPSKGVELLVKKLKRPFDVVFRILKRTDFLKGPPLDGFESIIAHEHLAVHDDCHKMGAAVLSQVVERLMSIIYRASSLAEVDPSRHYAPLNRSVTIPPMLMTKRVNCDSVQLAIREAKMPSFRYRDGLSNITLPQPAQYWNVMKKKMNMAGIGDFFDMMHRKAISSEAILLDEVTRFSQGKDMLNQLSSLISDECDSIRLRCSVLPEPCGAHMLITTMDHLTELAKEEPSRVYRQSFDFLLGLAGLLAGECKIWWSKPFDVEGEKL